MSTGSVNLLSPAAGQSVNQTALMREIRIVATAIVSVFVVVAVGAGVVNVIIDKQNTDAKNQEAELIESLAGVSTVDVLAQVLTSRVDTLMKISQKRRDLNKYLTVVAMTTPWSNLTAFSIGQEGQIALRFAPLEFSDALALGAKLLELSIQSTIAKAHFSQINLDSSGKVLMQLSFTP